MLTIGSLVLAVAIAPSSSAPAGRGLAWLLFLGSSVHVAGTGWLYTLPDVRSHARQHPGRYVYGPICLVVAGGVLAILVAPRAFGWLLLPYFGWQFVHFQKQNLGMASLASSSRGLAPLGSLERRALMVAGVAGVAGLVARPGLVQLKVDPGLGSLFPVVTMIFAVAVVGGACLLLSRPRSERPAGFCVVYLTSLCFSLPVFVFRSPYAAVGGMTIAHGLQYLLLVGLVAAGTQHGASRVVCLALLANVGLIGGLALNAAAHLHGGDAVARCLFGGYLGVVMAHFVVDAGVWRLRDAFPRRFLAARVPYLLTSSSQWSETAGDLPAGTRDRLQGLHADDRARLD